ncbi:MAG: phospho-sugar mutase [Bacteroidales bacterium]|jgi:phosphoglucomutase|nr:phospho-sugar mutase [Bacteroidales bacterium]MCI2121143.1 phospho-sugar mutase [Bacteroidales bacterium]MCI2144732.1 phospho-sugar mutase [Bacteroidales bacterium]
MENWEDVARSWLGSEYDVATRTEVSSLFNTDRKELKDRFYRILEFGTGGLRGIMGAGTNRMNRYVVAMATQGLSNYLKTVFPDGQIKTVISFDSRNNSREFAKVTSDVFMANGIYVYLFDNIRPTPELSFAIRRLHCNAGVMITASHNPKQYNGYKVFWQDGAQITAPHDKNIIEEVRKITSPSQVEWGDGLNYPELIGPDIDAEYLNSILSLTLSPDSVKRHNDLKIVYTPLHGTGVYLVPRALAQIGFTKIYHVPDQDVSDGNFPTVASPNPEEHSALKMAIDRGEEVGADVVLASDPDGDRVGAAVRDDKGDFYLLNGNQAASILTKYMLERWKELGKLSDKAYTVKTIVTTGLMKDIADSYHVKMYNVLTGFKYIAQVVRENEGKGMTFICGGEESNGFNAGEFVRDKDSVITCSLFAECAAWLADSGRTVYGFLQDIYKEYGYYRESLMSVYKTGEEGASKIGEMMNNFRSNPPVELAGSKVVKVIDYLEPEKTGLPKSNVLQFVSENGSVVSVRPSGTEPKIKFYLGIRGNDADKRIRELTAQFGESE